MRNGSAGPPGPNGRFIFRRYRRTRNGRVLDAHDYGYKAWKIPLR